MEVWKVIEDYPNYEVSNMGRVRSYGKRILKATKDMYYCKVGLYKDKVQKKITIHQLVAICFLNHNPDGYSKVVNHINFNGYDNNVNNLEIVSPRENSNKKHLKSTSKYVGVSWYKRYNKWNASIFINGKPKNLGYFNTELEASQEYNKELKKIQK